MAETPIPAASGAAPEEAPLLAVPDLVALRATVSNGALKGESLPTRIKIFAWGDNPSTKGVYRAGERTAALLAANQRGLGFERVAIDYNHCTVEGSPEYIKGQPKAIFGYGKIVPLIGDGVFLEDVEWTPLGVANARNYEDLSPAAHQTDGEIDFIHSVALTPNGCLYDVTFFSASGSGTDGKNKTDKNNDVMNEPNKTTPAGVITLALLSSALGLAATAAEADVMGKIKKLSALEPLEGLIKDGKVLIIDELSAFDGRLKAIEKASTEKVALLSANVEGKVVNFTGQDVVLLGARIEKMERELLATASASSEVEKGRLLTLFAADGKVPKNADGQPYAAEELKNLDVQTLKLLHANTPATVPLSARTRAATEGKGLDPNVKGRARFISAQERDNAATR